MKLREVHIENFRCLVNVTVHIDDETILVGANNSGKTAFLHALTSVLPATAASRRNAFDEYDYYMVNPKESPESSNGILIELWFREDHTGEWPDSLIQGLHDIIVTDPSSDIDSIVVRVTSKFDPLEDEIVTGWEFLNLNRQPLGGRGADLEIYPHSCDIFGIFCSHHSGTLHMSFRLDRHIGVRYSRNSK